MKKYLLIFLSVVFAAVVVYFNVPAAKINALTGKTYKDNELFCYQIFLKGNGYNEVNNMRYGYKDGMGRIVLPAVYEDCCGWEGFHDGIKPVKYRGSWEYIDTSGRTILKIRKKYMYLNNFSEDLAGFTVEHGPGESPTEGFIDRKGNEVIPPIYGIAYSFSEGLSAVLVMTDKNGNRGGWGYIDKQGKMVIPAKFSDANSFKDGFASVCLGDCPAKTDNYIIDHSGNTIDPFRWSLSKKKK